jgi:hypothetical protein
MALLENGGPVQKSRRMRKDNIPLQPNLNKQEKQLAIDKLHCDAPHCNRCRGAGHAAAHCTEDDPDLLCIWCGYQGHSQGACALAADTAVVRRFTTGR